MMLLLFQGFAQSGTDSSAYKNRKLKFEEANLVSSYYSQDGNNSAVTGGIGTEKLTDISNSFEVSFSKFDKKFRKHSFDLEVGVDHYTSASSDMVDLKANSSASYSDNRIYPSLNYSVENDKKGIRLGGGAGFSTEYDYTSINFNGNASVKTKNRSGEFYIKLQAFLDQVRLVTPIELRPGYDPGNEDEDDHYGTSARTTFNASLSYSQIVNQRLQLMLLADLVSQSGYLGLPFHRVYFTDNSLHQENLPSKRFKYPVGIRANYFLGDRIILRAYYRYYADDWGINGSTASLEVPVKITPFISVSPFYRFYHQNGADYFAGYRQHGPEDTYFTSNYDLSTFQSNFFGAGLRLMPPAGVFGIKHVKMLELRYGHYNKNIGMQSDIISLNLQFK
jgi:hypothetical protein